MGAVKSYDDFINKIRGLDVALNRLRVKNVEIDKKAKVITYVFICDKTVSDDLKKKIADKADEMTSKSFSKVLIKVEKIVSDSQLVNFKIIEYIKANHPSCSMFLSESDVSSRIENDIIRYTLKLSGSAVDMFLKYGALKELDRFLTTEFCSDVIGTVEKKPEEEMPDILHEEVFLNELSKVSYRTLTVKDVIGIDDITPPSVARYIEDVEDGANTLSGVITRISEKTTKTGKPFFILEIDDTTDRISGIYFSKKNTVNKIKELKEGDAIITTGVYGDYNDRKSFTFEKINRCTFPTDFVKEGKPKKSAPQSYSVVKPEKATTVKAESVFDQNCFIPKVMFDNDYVVFDIETTGLDTQKDYITEIGAVKIKNGVISEQFTTLLSIPVRVPERIVSITGITDEMLEGKPSIDKVFPDFIKFTEGAVLVVHNADFDPPFMRRYAKEFEYEFRNTVMDTCAISKKLLPELKRFDLHTVAERFNVVFHHHRALSDAYATAEVFIELMRIQEGKK